MFVIMEVIVMNNAISERRIRNNKLRRNRQLRRHALIIICTFFMITFLSVFCFGTKAKAQSSDEAAQIKYKYYKSVLVESGDTLWAYAEEYADNDYYDSYDKYINEVIHINHLEDGDITSGKSIILPYYSYEFIY